MATTETVRKATGREQAEWYSLLDAWGAPGRPFKEIAAWLTGEHGLSRWWAQKLIVEYEQERGLRPAGIRPNGTFEVGASKTVAVPLTRLVNAFVDARRRKRWLRDGKMKLRGSDATRSARFDWEDGSSRVNVSFVEKGPSKSAVTVAHHRLTGAGEAQRAKEQWRQRLLALKEHLET